jgi:hypothetical protein
VGFASLGNAVHMELGLVHQLRQQYGVRIGTVLVYAIWSL